MKAHTERVQRSTHFQTFFDEAYSAINNQYGDDTPLDREADIFLARLEEEGIDELYQMAIYEQFLMSRMLTDEEACRRGLEEATLTAEAAGVIRQWIEAPPFYMAFSIVDSYGDNIYEIEDLVTKESLFFYSPGLKRMQRKGKTRDVHYFTLMFDNGLCLQSAGMIHHNSLVADDYLFLCKVIDEELYEDHGLDGVLKSHPIALFMLDWVSETPSIMLDEHNPFVVCVGEVTDVNCSFDEPYWRSTEINGSMRYMFDRASDEMIAHLGESSYLLEPWKYAYLVYRIDSRWVLVSHTEESFHFLVTLTGAKNLAMFGKINPALLIRLQRMGYALPWSPFGYGMDEGEREESEESVAINRMLLAYGEARNAGKDFDIEREAARFGVDYSIAVQIVENVEERHKQYLWKVPKKEQQYETDGWPRPAPIQRDAFGDSIEGSSLFFLLDSEHSRERFDAYTQGRYTDEMEDEHVLSFIEYLFCDAWYVDLDEAHFVFNTVLWIMLHKKSPVMVRTLAVELFKLYPILSNEWEFDEFANHLSEVIIYSFLGTSLFKVAERPRGQKRNEGRYTVEPADFLYSLVTPIPLSV